ncbi:MAG: UPF0182 family protein, partial [Bacteroidota bacterium]
MRRLVYLIIGLVVLALVAVVAGAGFLTDWLWFKSLGAAAVFWTGFLTGWAVRLTAFGLTFLFFLANFALALRAFTRLRRPEEDVLDRLGLEKAALSWLNIAASAILALFVSAAFNPGWAAVQQFLHPVAANVKDPVFHRDIGYYLFQFPIWRSLNGLLQSLAWLALLGAGAIYWISRAFWRQGDRYVLWPQAKTHLTALAILLFVVKIWGYNLARQGLLFTGNGLITGIDYTAATVRLPVYNLLGVIAAVCAALLVAGLFRRGFRLFLAGVGLLLLSSFVLGTIAPELVRSFIVRPNEFAKERVYIQRHIAQTRQAFGLDRFTVRDYRFVRTEADLRPDSPTLTNLRLWDFRPLKQTYEQLQTMRPYYTFNEIDIDRYTIGRRQRQVMLSAREMDVTDLPTQAQNWTNMHLAYTHGYGIALNGVNQVNEEGQPVFLVGNLPPRIAPGTGLTLRRSQIYFGEGRSDYIVAPNGYEEFDYPTGTGERKTNYTGRDGVPLRSFWTRALFALRYGDLNFLLSAYVEPGRSKAIFHRNVMERVRKLAPFLEFDRDPYIVAAEGRLYWIIDAYTVSGYYPYAARHNNGINYMRNAVKTVVDAYDGTVTFYVADPADPVIRVWQRVFPRLFTPLDRMSAALRAHLRYPEDYFRVQRDML